jgi:hypothetical protein
MPTTRKHHNVTTSDYEVRTQQVVERKPYHPPSREKQVMIAKASREGGRGYCRSCHTNYGMTYLRPANYGLFDNDLACIFCIEDRLVKKV